MGKRKAEPAADAPSSTQKPKKPKTRSSKRAAAEAKKQATEAAARAAEVAADMQAAAQMAAQVADEVSADQTPDDEVAPRVEPPPPPATPPAPDDDDDDDEAAAAAAAEAVPGAPGTVPAAATPKKKKSLPLELSDKQRKDLADHVRRHPILYDHSVKGWNVAAKREPIWRAWADQEGLDRTHHSTTQPEFIIYYL